MLFLAAEDTATEDLKAGVDICLFESEFVRHSIEFFDPSTPHRTTLIQMETEGNIQSMLSGDQPRSAIQSIDRLIELGLNSNTNVIEIISMFEQAATEDHVSPQCYLCDTDFIGLLETKVTHINDHKLSQASQLAIQRGWFDINDDFHGMCIDDYENCFNIKKIQSYISTVGEGWGNTTQGFGRKLVCSDHITIDHIEESYKRGSLLKYSAPELLLCNSFEIQDHEAAPPETVIAIKPENKDAIRKAIHAYLHRE